MRVSWRGRALQDECLGRLPLGMGFQGQCRAARVCRHCAPAHGLEVAPYGRAAARYTKMTRHDTEGFMPRYARMDGCPGGPDHK